MVQDQHAASHEVTSTAPTAPPEDAARDAEEAAAVKIQSAFRSYLARKALCALRGMVKLQAIVRGQLVRRQADMTLRRIQALVAAQRRAHRAAAAPRGRHAAGADEPPVAAASLLLPPEATVVGNAGGGQQGLGGEWEGRRGDGQRRTTQQLLLDAGEGGVVLQPEGVAGAVGDDVGLERADVQRPVRGGALLGLLLHGGVRG
ncbi:hypothetical protein ZWY2020_028389 [Hordeum vulgare]|nr:hypothetical protein ZWY2020_028389 [Hordeum vulgare]